MLTIQIQDEQLARQLQAIAEHEQRPLEAVLKSLIAHYPVESSLPTSTTDQSEAIQQIRYKVYDKARQYWVSAGDTHKANLTNEEMEAQFAWFDEEGVPRLKSELESLEPPLGSLAYAGKMAREANIRTQNPTDSSRADDILNEEFADYLLKRMRGEDASE
jgi:hypothetical protein